VLQLIQLGRSDADKEWGEFLHVPGQKFETFSEIRDEIQHETDRLAGENKGINPVPINLKIYSKKVIPLTLVDLPGTTKVAIGDQPTDIERQIRSMILGYIRKPTAIIMAVTPANSDIANSDALKLARSVDPDGTRTLGVLTKVDIMDRGTDVVDILRGRVYPLRLGFVAVINRSQQDINDGKAIAAALQSEQEWFDSNAQYSAVRGQCSTEYLASRTNELLMGHIRDSLPELRGRINGMLLERQRELSSLGGSTALDDESQQGAMLLQILTRFAQDFKGAVAGAGGDMQELSGGARINYIFNDVFAATVEQVDPARSVSLDDIRTAIRNSSGTKTSLFVSEGSFELVVKSLITRLHDPIRQCVELVYQELLRIVASLNNDDLERFKYLREALGIAVNKYFRSRLDPTQEFVRNLVLSELAYINTNHPDFTNGTAAMAGMIGEAVGVPYDDDDGTGGGADPLDNRSGGGRRQSQSQSQSQSQAGGGGLKGFFFRGGNKSTSGAFSNSAASAAMNANGGGVITLPALPQSIRPDELLSEKEKTETQLIFQLVNSYFAIVRKNLSDSVPKAIMLFLVNHVVENLQSELVKVLYRHERFNDLMSEDENVQRRRKSCNEIIAMLTKAQQIVADVRDSNRL